MATKTQSRTARWKVAAQRLLDAQESVRNAVAAYNDALAELRDVRDEYEDWRSNLPENLEQSALAEKLDAVVEMDLDELDEPDMDAADEAADMDLPRGFGRD